MCQATVYLAGREIAQDVIWLESNGDDVHLATFFEEPMVLRARIRRIDFLKHQVFLTPLGENDARPGETAPVDSSLDGA